MASRRLLSEGGFWSSNRLPRTRQSTAPLKICLPWLNSSALINSSKPVSELWKTGMKKSQLRNVNPLPVAASSCPARAAHGAVQEESLAVLSGFVTGLEVISACFSPHAVVEVFDPEPSSTDSAKKCFLASSKGQLAWGWVCYRLKQPLGWAQGLLLFVWTLKTGWLLQPEG